MSQNSTKCTATRNVRWSLISESEKRDILRKRNTQNARESRKKWKISDNEIKELFDSNEEKIRGLEKLVLEMTKQLDGRDESSIRINPSSSQKAKSEIDVWYTGSL